MNLLKLSAGSKNCNNYSNPLHSRLTKFSKSWKFKSSDKGKKRMLERIHKRLVTDSQN